MRRQGRLLTGGLLLGLMACGKGGEVGDACTEDADCADGLECHIHDDHDHEGAAEEEEEEEPHGECEEHDHEEE